MGCGCHELRLSHRLWRSLWMWRCHGLRRCGGLRRSHGLRRCRPVGCGGSLGYGDPIGCGNDMACGDRLGCDIHMGCDDATCGGQSAAATPGAETIPPGVTWDVAIRWGSIIPMAASCGGHKAAAPNGMRRPHGLRQFHGLQQRAGCSHVVMHGCAELRKRCNRANHSSSLQRCGRYAVHCDPPPVRRLTTDHSNTRAEWIYRMCAARRDCPQFACIRVSESPRIRSLKRLPVLCPPPARPLARPHARPPAARHSAVRPVAAGPPARNFTLGAHAVAKRGSRCTEFGEFWPRRHGATARIPLWHSWASMGPRIRCFRKSGSHNFGKNKETLAGWTLADIGRILSMSARIWSSWPGFSSSSAHT